MNGWRSFVRTGWSRLRPRHDPKGWYGPCVVVKLSRAVPTLFCSPTIRVATPGPLNRLPRPSTPSPPAVKSCGRASASSPRVGRRVTSEEMPPSRKNSPRHSALQVWKPVSAWPTGPSPRRSPVVHPHRLFPRVKAPHSSPPIPSTHWSRWRVAVPSRVLHAARVAHQRAVPTMPMRLH